MKEKVIVMLKWVMEIVKCLRKTYITCGCYLSAN